MNRLYGALAAALLASAALAQAPQVSGEVTKVDLAAGRVTIKHGEVRKLDMPPMTMTYRVRDPKLLDGVAAGDRVRFAPERIDGQYVVTALSKAP